MNPFKLFCWLGFHAYHTAPNNMLKWCPNCNDWQVNTNCSDDPIRRWRSASHAEVLKLQDMWRDNHKVL